MEREARTRCLPRAREAGLLSRELPGGELVVYDTDRHRAHSLNRTATLIWQACDGQTPLAEVSTRLRKLDLPGETAVIELALARLEKAHLLAERLPVSESEGLTRRAVVRRLGLTAGLAALLPVITSIAAPTPAMAASGAGGGPCPCTGGCSIGQCCCQTNIGTFCMDAGVCSSPFTKCVC